MEQIDANVNQTANVVEMGQWHDGLYYERCGNGCFGIISVDSNITTRN